MNKYIDILKSKYIYFNLDGKKPIKNGNKKGLEKIKG